MNNLFKMIYQPVTAFQALKNTEKFPFLSLIVLLIITIINNILLLPITIKMQEITISSMAMPLSDEQMNMSMQLLYKLRYLQVLGALFSYVFMSVVYTLIIWIFTKIAKEHLSFQKALELIIYCSFALALGSLTTTVLLHVRGVENIDNIFEISLIGLNVLTSTESVGLVVYSLLAFINPFYLWFVVLLTIGLASLTDMKMSKAGLLSLLFCFILVAFSISSVYFSQVFMKSKGLM